MELMEQNLDMPRSKDISKKQYFVEKYVKTKVCVLKFNC